MNCLCSKIWSRKWRIWTFLTLMPLSGSITICKRCPTIWIWSRDTNEWAKCDTYCRCHQFSSGLAHFSGNKKMILSDTFERCNNHIHILHIVALVSFSMTFLVDHLIFHLLTFCWLCILFFCPPGLTVMLSLKKHLQPFPEKDHHQSPSPLKGQRCGM